ncbi:hypothetical protein NAP1_13758 [Erythrobacter sp. NAP1]|nr:hypothetical protein NAP1_13758 [Erythrobacter sp. NAP1]
MSSELSKVERRLSVLWVRNSRNDNATMDRYLPVHGHDADHNYHHDNLGFPGAVAAGLGSALSPPGFGWRGVLPKSQKD